MNVTSFVILDGYLFLPETIRILSTHVGVTKYMWNTQPAADPSLTPESLKLLTSPKLTKGYTT